MAATVAVAAGACGGYAAAPRNAALSPAASLAAGLHVVDLARAVQAPAGQPITTGGAVTLPMRTDRGTQQPVATLGRRILLSETPPQDASGAVERFYAWDPVTGARSALWDSSPGQQDVVTATEGDIVAFVRTGLSLPFADWQLIVRNTTTGEDQVIAHGDPRVASFTSVKPPLPLGYAPVAMLGSGRVAWAQYALEGGALHRQVLVQELATAHRTVLADVDTGSGADLESPSLAGDTAAWVELAAGGSAALVVHQLDSGISDRYAVPGSPFAARLLEEGRAIAWDDQLSAKYVLDFASGAVTRYAGSEGWGVFPSGGRISWAPAAAYGGAAGYFDLQTGEVRTVARRPGAITNLAQVFGQWFGWQELPAATAGQPREGDGIYYFVPLDP